MRLDAKPKSHIARKRDSLERRTCRPHTTCSRQQEDEQPRQGSFLHRLPLFMVKPLDSDTGRLWSRREAIGLWVGREIVVKRITLQEGKRFAAEASHVCCLRLPPTDDVRWITCLRTLWSLNSVTHVRHERSHDAFLRRREPYVQCDLDEQRNDRLCAFDRVHCCSGSRWRHRNSTAQTALSRNRRDRLG